MKSIQEILPILNLILEGMAKHFGPNCEFVVHDYTKGFGSTIVSIFNGEVTGRSIGKGGTSVGLRVLQGDEQENGKFNYFSQTKDGRLLKSSTIYIKDDDGKLIGSICINSDVTKIIDAKNALEEFLNIENNDSKNNIETIVYEDVEDLLISMINESINFIGTPVALMTREQKIKGIQYLKKRGAFKIQNAVNIVAQYYDISKYTVYNYINEVDVN